MKKLLYILGGVILVIIIIAIAGGGGEEKKGIQPEKTLLSEEKIETKQGVQKLPKSSISDEEAVKSIKKALEDKGFHVAKVQVEKVDGRKTLLLGYISPEYPLGMIDVLDVYLETVRSGWDIDQLGADASNKSGTNKARWYCVKEWTDEFRNGKISSDGILAKVLGSAERY